MSLTVLDPHSALIVIDLQKGVAALPLAHPVAEVAGNAARLAQGFRARGLPVILVRATGMAPGRTERSFSRPADAPRPPADSADLLPELNQQDSDHELLKQTWGAFMNPELDQLLRKLEVTQVVVIGIATSFGVESTARQAYEHGYHVTLATDAMTDFSVEAHEGSVVRIFPSLGETGTTAEVLALLESAPA
ncbi:isochorismatase family protein [Nocardia macrotermitis]|uniref:Isochorismatase family protein YecD n=1 Tax=Nocardia macrotermitis TaxID=2585198 RepID=A0A7K0D765_9NOCA|nr:isochorismatase family protein [Nocardia macrotermitis]MQY21557.1 Isochorismatase family protein YecD [Nocardia macrotermitis]